MNLSSFLDHYGITENPFRAEEAGQDVVFERIERRSRHPDFEKICGDFGRPSTAIVFGERGAGKTAIRLQIEQAVTEHNERHPDRRCLTIPYDDLNPVLDRYQRQVGLRSPEVTIQRFTLADHMDAIINAIVPGIVDQLLGTLRGAEGPLAVEDTAPKALRQLDRATRHDLLMLQVCYDRPALASDRTAALKRRMRYRSRNLLGERKWMMLMAGVLTAAAAAAFVFMAPQQHVWVWQGGLAVLALATLVLAGRCASTWLRTQRIARDLARHLRVLHRPAASFRRSLLCLNTLEVQTAELPRSGSEDARYAMLSRLLGAIRPFGYRSIIVLVDRIDEPTLIRGEPARMQALVWPLLNNKFLQQEHIGLKLLLPLELRFLLNREDASLFRQARLDKQNFIDRLQWSGAILYDLCSARLNACRDPEEPPISLMDLFDPSVTHQDVVDALDQMQQPRDAFKFLYALLQEHCSNIPEEKPVWKIARPTLDGVRKLQTERMAAMLRGVAPA